jgi:peptidoglycan/xylan/chitin deacetylase (PgdA/CDA1 family)
MPSPEKRMPSVRSLLQQAVKASAAAVDTVRPPKPGVVILIYHRIGAGSALEVDLPIERFDAQMAWLAASGRVATLEEALATLSDPTGAATDAASRIVVTFDDGTADFSDHAVPVIERHRVPVTLYAATEFIDRGLAFPDEGVPLSWTALRDAHSTGLVAVGSHTHRHRLLDRLPPGEVDDELDRSIDLIADNIGQPPRDFAYPKALLGSPAAERSVRARFRSAAVAGTRPNAYAATDPYRLARSPVQVSDGDRWFVRKARGGMALEDGLRRSLNRRRYAAATT